ERHPTPTNNPILVARTLPHPHSPNQEEWPTSPLSPRKPVDGFEPPSRRSQNGRSATELHRHHDSPNTTRSHRGATVTRPFMRKPPKTNGEKRCTGLRISSRFSRD